MNKKILSSFLMSALCCSAVFVAKTQHVQPVLEANADTSVAAYYSNISSNERGNDLKASLYNLIKGHTVYSYNKAEFAMRSVDRNWSKSADPNIKNPYMRLLYAEYNDSNPQEFTTFHGSLTDEDGVTYGDNTNGGKNAVWNKEHVWAQSNGVSGAAKSDLHHLYASDKKIK